jgi:hypothetical protein
VFRTASTIKFVCACSGSDGVRACLLGWSKIYTVRDCRCLVSDHTPRDTLTVLLGKTVLLIVAQWFVLRARERDRRFSAGSGRFERYVVILYFLGWVCICDVLQVVSPEWRRANDLKMMGSPYALYTRPWNTPYVHGDDIFPVYLETNSKST